MLLGSAGPGVGVGDITGAAGASGIVVTGPAGGIGVAPGVEGLNVEPPIGGALASLCRPAACSLAKSS